MFNTLISPGSLHEALKSTPGKHLILDCRFNLADTSHGRRAYGLGHIPGAHFLDLDEDLSSPIGPETGRHPLPDPERLWQTLCECGLEPGMQVFVYDDTAGANAARAWFLLRWLGHHQVAVLDGGFPAWQAAGLEIETAQPTRGANRGERFPGIDTGMNVTTREVEDNLGTGNFTVVDARSRERYLGEMEPIDPVAGHIPGALNRPLSDNLQDGSFKSAELLREEWLGVLAGRPAGDIVHMCGSGVTACHNQLAMTIAGLNGSRVYSGSWSEWIRNPARPVATNRE